MKKIYFLVLCFALIIKYTESYSWGSQGHKIVAEIAYHYLDNATRDSVKKYLGEMTFQDAATWMDDIRKDTANNYMKPWHYINVEKDKTYVKLPNENIINELDKVIDQLLNGKRNPLKTNTDVKILFHLIGDLHQPLHVGYGGDKGGNSVDVVFSGKKSNLHKVWDTEIISEKKITTEMCLKIAGEYSSKKVKKIQKIDTIKWMSESRSYLKNVYDFKVGIIDQKYIDKNAPIVEKQLVNAGLRLAGVLSQAFKSN